MDCYRVYHGYQKVYGFWYYTSNYICAYPLKSPQRVQNSVMICYVYIHDIACMVFLYVSATWIEGSAHNLSAFVARARRCMQHNRFNVPLDLMNAQDKSALQRIKPMLSNISAPIGASVLFLLHSKLSMVPSQPMHEATWRVGAYCKGTSHLYMMVLLRSRQLSMLREPLNKIP